MPYNKWNIDTMNEYCKTQNNGYIVVETKYIKKSYQNQLWALVKCKNESHEPYWVCWNNFIRGHLCKHCYQEKYNISSWTTDRAYEFLKNNGYEMLNKNDFENVDKCVYCYDKNRFILNISISNLKRYLSNSKVKGFSITKNNKYAVYNIKLYCKLYRPEYEFISDEFLGVKEKHIFKYIGDELLNNVDRTFKCTIDNFINGGVKHPAITMSKGEYKIKKILDMSEIHHCQEFSFKDCRDKKVLPFDFYIPSINTAIEYQGRQHYETILFFGGDKAFRLRKKHDEIKYQYCKNKNIKLIRIPYWDFNNIEQILKNEQII